MKGTGISPYDQMGNASWALAPEGMRIQIHTPAPLFFAAIEPFERGLRQSLRFSNIE
jgi:hypothetical protein